MKNKILQDIIELLYAILWRAAGAVGAKKLTKKFFRKAYPELKERETEK